NLSHEPADLRRVYEMPLGAQELHRQNIRRIESGLGGVHFFEASNQEAGVDQHHERESHLRDNQPIAESAVDHGGACPTSPNARKGWPVTSREGSPGPERARTLRRTKPRLLLRTLPLDRRVARRHQREEGSAGFQL